MIQSLIRSSLTSVFGRGSTQLRWGLPEPWVHAELFSELTSLGHLSPKPFSFEAPYVTSFPVRLPKESNRDWKKDGAVKWIDLCLHSAQENHWYWIEIKTRHADTTARAAIAEKAAQDAFRKDVVALVGFDRSATASLWRKPDFYTSAYWMDDALKPKADALEAGTHTFLSIYLGLWGGFPTEVWEETEVRKSVSSWHISRSRDSVLTFPEPDYRYETFPLGAEHNALMVSWTAT